MNLKSFLNNLNFENIISCSEVELKKIKDIRNEDNIRKNMRTKHKILIKEHSEWFEKIKNSKKNFFYVIKYKNNIIGGLGLSNYDKDELFENGLIISQKKLNLLGWVLQ